MVDHKTFVKTCRENMNYILYMIIDGTLNLNFTKINNYKYFIINMWFLLTNYDRSNQGQPKLHKQLFIHVVYITINDKPENFL